MPYSSFTTAVSTASVPATTVVGAESREVVTLGAAGCTVRLAREGAAVPPISLQIDLTSALVDAIDPVAMPARSVGAGWIIELPSPFAWRVTTAPVTALP